MRAEMRTPVNMSLGTRLTVPRSGVSSFGINCSHVQVAADADGEERQVKVSFQESPRCLGQTQVFKVLLEEQTEGSAGAWTDAGLTDCSGLPECGTFRANTRSVLGNTGGVGHLSQQGDADQTVQGGQHSFPPFLVPHLPSHPDLDTTPF